MTWWIWILAGLGLLAAEVIIPGGIIMLFLGVAALIVGVLVAIGVGGPLWFQILLFSVLSVVSLLTLRGPILRRMQARHSDAEQVDSIVGTGAVLTEDIAPGAEGKAELRGTAWTAVNLGTRALSKGERCIVEKVEGLTLFIR